MHFARVLRAAGLPVGPGRALEGVRAVITAGVGRREDFYWTLFAVFVNRQDHCDLFDQAFHVFWRNPRILERLLHDLMPQVQVEVDPDRNEAISRRIAEALAQDPHKTFSDARHSAAVAQMKTFFDQRANFVDDWLVDGDPCPASW